MSYNFCVKNKLFAGKIIRFSKIAEGSNSPNLPLSQLPNDNMASIGIEGLEILYIEVDNTFNVSLNVDPVPGDLTIQKNVTTGKTSWKLFSNSNAKDGTPVNVTVGQDEPKIRRNFLIAVAIAVAFYLLSGLLKEVSQSLWLATAGVLVIFLIGITIQYLFIKKEGIISQKSNLNV
ncbi:MAG: hypothetical protein MUF15_16355 [Acidobacteria bacterium]|jgi:hypothetical protein|nr:hypothetical protein [Acidobacteriota bacterium]